MLQLISSINSPNQNNPKGVNNIEVTKTISKNLKIDFNENYFLNEKEVQKNLITFKESTIVPLEIKNYITNDKESKTNH
jgi:hypothetical protein